MFPVIAVSVCGCDAFGFLAGTAIQWILTELLFGSLQTTSLIAINRYFCVVKPSLYRKYFRPKKVILMIAMSWVANLVPTMGVYASGITSMDFYASRYMRFPYFIGPYTGHIITAVYQVLFTVVPATLSTVCNWKIHRQIKSHKASLGNTNEVSSLSATTTEKTSFFTVAPNQAVPAVTSNHTSSLPVPGNQMSSVAQVSSPSLEPNPSSASASTTSNQTAVASNPPSSVSVEEIKITKSLMMIVIGFCICWFPSSTVLHLSTHIRLPRLVDALLIYCGFTSSAINPILYNVYNRPFRRRAWKLLGIRNVVSVESMGFSSNAPGTRTTDQRSEMRAC